MSLKLRGLELHTEDLNAMAHFFTTVFDLEIYQMDSLYFDVNFFGLNLTIIESGAKTQSGAGNFQFVMDVVDREELESVFNKYQFYYYREYSKEVPSTIQASKDEASFDLYDPDQRLWRVEFKAKDNHASSPKRVVTDLLNVRNC